MLKDSRFWLSFLLTFTLVACNSIPPVKLPDVATIPGFPSSASLILSAPSEDSPFEASIGGGSKLTEIIAIEQCDAVVVYIVVFGNGRSFALNPRATGRVKIPPAENVEFHALDLGADCSPPVST